MKKYFFFALTAAMMSFAGCQEKELEAPVNPNQGGSTFELVADIAQTKTTLDATDYSVEWETGDIVYLVTSDGTWGAPYVDKDNTNLETIAEFVYADGRFTSDAAITAGEYTFKAMYAHESQKSYHRGESSTHKLQPTQTQDCANPTAHIKGNDALVGMFTAYVPATDKQAVTMSHLYTLMQVNVRNSTGASVDVTKFEMTAAGADLAGVFNVDFENTAITTKSSASSTITVNVTGGNVDAGQALPVYFVMAPLSDYTGDVTFKVTAADGKTYTKTIAVSNLDFNAGAYNTTPYTISEADEVEPEQTNVTWNLAINETSEATENRIAWTSDFAEMYCEKGGAGTPTNNYYGGNVDNRTSTRFYAKSVLTIAPKSGYAITSVVFEATSNNYATALGESTWTNASASASTTTVTVTPTDGTKAMVATLAGTCGCTSVVVYYEVSEGGETPETPETPGAWTLVTNVSDLAVGDEIIIAAKDYDFAVGAASANGNNRTQASVTKSGNTLTPGEGVMTFTLQAGTKADTYALYTGAKYLYAASSGSNYLKEQDNLDDNGSWNITIADTGAATIIAQGDKTRNIIRYNDSSSLFSCYESGKQKDVVIYKQMSSSGNEGGGETPDEVPEIVVTDNEQSIGAEGGDLEFEYTLKNLNASLAAEVVEGNEMVEDLSVGDGCVSVTVAENTSAQSRTAKIRLTCEAAAPVILTIVQEANVSVEPAEPTKVTVAEFVAAEDGDTVYELSGTISKINTAYNESYNNISFTLEDETGSVLIYRMSCEGLDDPMSLNVADEITVQGCKTTYNSASQMAQGGKYITHVDHDAPAVEIQNVSIADFKASTNSTTIYELTGAITSISTAYNSQYNNISFFFKDETGEVQVYRMSCVGVADPTSIKVGDQITIQGTKGEYNDTPQVAEGSKYISHISSATAPVITCVDNVVTITAESGATIYYTLNGADPTVSSTKYTAPFSINETVIVKAIALVNGKVQSAVAEGNCVYRAPGQDQVEPVSYTIMFGSNYNSGNISAYDKSWSVTYNGFKCNLANWNNNNNGWNYVKAGSKKFASVATITTASPIPEEMLSVTMKVDAITTSMINSIKLYVSTNSDFTGSETYNVTPKKGDLVFNITSPVKNAYYKIEVDCKQGSSNGLIQVSQVVFAN